MTGEMYVVSREEWGPHFAIADALGGTVKPFDVCQGPYISFGPEIRAGGPPYAKPVRFAGDIRLWLTDSCVTVELGQFGTLKKFPTEGRADQDYVAAAKRALVWAHGPDTEELPPTQEAPEWEEGFDDGCGHLTLEFQGSFIKGGDLIIDVTCQDCGKGGSFIVGPQEVQWVSKPPPCADCVADRGVCPICEEMRQYCAIRNLNTTATGHKCERST